MKHLYLVILSLFLLACASATPVLNQSARPVDREALSEFWIAQDAEINASFKAAPPSSPAQVTLKVLIDSEGNTFPLEVLKSSHPGEMDKFARRVAKQMKFAPSDSNPERIPVETTLVIDYAP